MILTASVDGTWHAAATEAEMSSLIDLMLRRQRVWFPSLGVGDHVTVSVARREVALLLGAPDPYRVLDGLRPDPLVAALAAELALGCGWTGAGTIAR